MLFNKIEGFNINNNIDKVKVAIIKLWIFVTDKFELVFILAGSLFESKCITLIICK